LPDHFNRLDQFYFPSDREVRKIVIYDFLGLFNGMRFYDADNNCLGQLCEICLEQIIYEREHYHASYWNMSYSRRVIQLEAGERIIGCKYTLEAGSDFETFYQFIIGKKTPN
jgi:hypothetical protein